MPIIARFVPFGETPQVRVGISAARPGPSPEASERLRWSVARYFAGVPVVVFEPLDMRSSTVPSSEMSRP